jgi:hypothetical protein
MAANALKAKFLVSGGNQTQTAAIEKWRGGCFGNAGETHVIIALVGKKDLFTLPIPPAAFERLCAMGAEIDLTPQGKDAIARAYQHQTGVFANPAPGVAHGS